MGTKEFEEKFLELLFQNFNVTKSCQILGENRSRGYSLLRRKGIKIPPIMREDEKDITTFCDKYKEGFTIKELHKMFPQFSEGKINYWLRKKGITRPRGKVSMLNHSYFEKIDTPQKAYFLGLLAADGSVAKSSKKKTSWRISLELKIEDKYIIEKFKEEIQTPLEVKETISESSSKINNKIYHSKKHNAYLRVFSNQMGKDLMFWGISADKTFSLSGIPDIDTNLKKWYVLGFFDGDGIVSFGKRNKYVGFCGTQKMLESIRDFLKEEINITSNITFNQSNHIYYITYSKKDFIKKFYQYFYNNPPVVFLKRKQEKTQSILNFNKLI